MAHARAKLTVLGRQLLVERVLIDGWKPADAAKAMGVSRQTAYKWLRRFRDEGPPGLEDRSSSSEALSTPTRCRRGGHHRGHSSRDPLWASQAGLYAWASPLDHLRGPPSRADLAFELHRPADPHRGALRAGAPWRAPPRGRQEAGPDPAGRWMADPRSAVRPARPRPQKERWLRLPPCGNRRSQSGRLCPGPG